MRRASPSKPRTSALLPRRRSPCPALDVLVDAPEIAGMRMVHLHLDRCGNIDDNARSLDACTRTPQLPGLPESGTRLER